MWTSLLGLPSKQHGPARLHMVFRRLAKWEKLIEKLELITDWKCKPTGDPSYGKFQ